MPDPIWLDNNIVDRAFKGDVDIRNQIAAYRSQGRRVLLVPWVHTEFLDGNWTADTGVSPKGKVTPPVGERGMQGAKRAQAEAFLKQSGIELDTSASKLPNKTRQSYIWDTKAPSGEVSNQDRMVLGQVKASAEAQGVKNPELYTAEKGAKAMVSQAKGWGITPIEHIEPPKPPTPVKPPGGSG